MSRFYKGCIRAMPVSTSETRREVILYGRTGNILGDEELKRFEQIALLNAPSTRRYGKHYRPRLPLREDVA